MRKLIYLMILPVVLGANFDMKEVFKNSLTFHRYPATYDEAKKICARNGGYLAVPTSRETEQVMLEVFRQSGYVVNPSHGLDAQAFIGLELGSYGWRTIFGENPPYLNWSRTWWGRQQPDHPTIQKCGSLLKEGGMDDVHCYYKLAFFCQKSETSELF